MSQHVNKKVKISSLKKGDYQNAEVEASQRKESQHVKSECTESECLDSAKEAFEITGTTSINDNGDKRQEILRKIFNKVSPFKNIKTGFEQYMYEGENGAEDAISILINGSEIGNINKADLKRFSDIAPSITGASLDVTRAKDENKHNIFCATVTFECNGEDNGTIEQNSPDGEIKYEKVDEATMKKVVKSYKSNIKFLIFGAILLVVFCIMKSWVFAIVLAIMLGFFVFSTIKMYKVIKRNKKE